MRAGGLKELASEADPNRVGELLSTVGADGLQEIANLRDFVYLDPEISDIFRNSCHISACSSC